MMKSLFQRNRVLFQPCQIIQYPKLVLQWKPRRPILALDVGSKYIGVAISDHGTSRAIPLQALRRRDDQLHKTANSLISIANDFGIQAIVVGVPNGDEHRSTKIIHFIHTLWNSTPALERIPVVLQDESFSTFEALVEMGGPLEMNHHKLLREASRRQKNGS